MQNIMNIFDGLGITFTFAFRVNMEIILNRTFVSDSIPFKVNNCTIFTHYCRENNNFIAFSSLQLELQLLFSECANFFSWKVINFISYAL